MSLVILFQANGGQAGELARLGSCFQDPQDTALDCILTRNLAGLTNILADAARLGDDDYQVETAKQVELSSSFQQFEIFK